MYTPGNLEYTSKFLLPVNRYVTVRKLIFAGLSLTMKYVQSYTIEIRDRKLNPQNFPTIFLTSQFFLGVFMYTGEYHRISKILLVDFILPKLSIGCDDTTY